MPVLPVDNDGYELYAAMTGRAGVCRGKGGIACHKPLIAIVGRPNVGKSTLFNKLAGARISIVQDTPGVTRDRIYYECEWRGKTVMLVDTGGIEPHIGRPDPFADAPAGAARDRCGRT